MTTTATPEISSEGSPSSSPLISPTAATFVVKASGEAFGSAETALSYQAFLNLAEQIVGMLDDGNRVAVVVGGGNIARGAELAELWHIRQDGADRAGMFGTGVNAELLAEVLDSLGVRCAIVPRGLLKGLNEGWGPDAIRAALSDGVVVIIAGGLGVTRISTDVATLSLAADLEADAVLMAKHDVDGVYTADPATEPTATRYDLLSATEALEKRLAFMDPQALELAISHRIVIRVVAASSSQHTLLQASRGERLGTVVRPV